MPKIQYTHIIDEGYLYGTVDAEKQIATIDDFYIYPYRKRFRYWIISDSNLYQGMSTTEC